MASSSDYEYLVIGGGFYGCCLALYLRSISRNILLLEKGQRLLDRASRVNQARVHTGFHYPRSAITAVKSLHLQRQFVEKFPEAIYRDFQMLYAISRKYSKVSAHRFERMFVGMGAPITRASPSQAALFDSAFIEQVFACTERAFDFSVLRDSLSARLTANSVSHRLNTEVVGLTERANDVVVSLLSGEKLYVKYVFNVTYSQINHLLQKANIESVGLKHELTEIALIESPQELRQFGVTVMDGPFFSTMPYPSAGFHSLTHVRYTPHKSWTDASAQRSAYDVFGDVVPQSRVRFMLADSQRYIPCLTDAVWVRSLYDVKTVMLKNEVDDGRPILFHRQPAESRIISIMGGKIDNVFDLFELINTTHSDFRYASDRFVYG